MTDRELLHMAAKAAGITLSEQGEYRPNTLVDVTDPGRPRYWNPLTDDGDALRLAVKLGIKVVPYPIFAAEKHSVIASRRWWPLPEGSVQPTGPEVIEAYRGDPNGATRRAIVRAAAAMGEQA